VAETTKYQVETEYKVEDHATTAIHRMESAFKLAAHGIANLQNRFREFRQEQRFTAAAALGVGIGLGAWIEKAKEANQEFESTKKGVTGLLAAMLEWPKGITPMERFTQASKLAGETTEHLEATAGRYGQQLPDIAQGYKYLAAAMAPLHLTTEQQLDLTDKVAATAKTTGTDVSMAFMQMGRAIMFHGVRPVGVLGATLKNALDSEGKMGKKAGRAGALNRLKLIEGVMKEQVPMADMMSQGMGDSLNRLQMEVSKIFRKLTGGVFKEISHEIAGWSKKISELSDNGVLDRWSHNLVDAFHTLQSVSGFIADHWKVIAGVWATFKIGSMGAGLAGSLGGAAGAIGSVLGSTGSLGMLGKGFMMLSTSMGPVILGMAALAGATWYLVQRWKKEDVSREGMKHVIGVAGQFGGGVPMGPLSAMERDKLANQIEELHHAGVVGEKGLDKQALAYHISRMDEQAKATLGQQLYNDRTRGVGGFSDAGLATKLAEQLVPMLTAHPELLPGYKAAVASTDSSKPQHFTGKQVGPFTGPITLNMKFDDVDPDRVWVGIKRHIEQEADARTSSQHAPAWAE
jgi:hypothetical protein